VNKTENKITNKGGKAILKALKLNSTLKKLSIADNGKLSGTLHKEMMLVLNSSDRFVVVD